MLSWRLHTRPEKAELQELNARLYDYVCRVRELEREHLLLEEELRAGRRGREGDLRVGGRQARCADEARGLRQQLDELSWATALAEGERDALRHELRALQRLGEEARAARGRLDAELGAQRRELQEALGARAALEATLGRLQAERRGLDAAHERQVRELRARAAASRTLRYRARPAAPPPHLREVHDRYAQLVSESWRDAVHLYEDEVRELEAALRRGQESRLQAEEETRLCAQEAEALQRQALELEQRRALLEGELQRMREALELQAEERQSVLACLEDEKAALTLAMADRLRDYQELVKVKTGLSLEVATYRALLEGESNPEILILTERLENLPQEFGNTSYQYTKSVLQRENERNLFPRQKAPSGSFRHSSALHSNLWAQRASQTGSVSGRGFLGSGYPSFTTTRRENAYEKTASSPPNVRTFSPARGLVRNTEAQVKTFPSKPRTEGTRDVPIHVAREPSLAQESHRERHDNVMVAGERTVILGKKTEARATREQEGSRAGTVQAKREEKLFDSKEKASEERNLRWEELTKLDREARQRGSQQMRQKTDWKEPSREESVRAREAPIHREASQDSTPEGAPGGSQTPLQKDAGGGPAEGVERRETKLRWDARDATDSLTGDSMTKTIAENIVSGILKQLAQSPGTETPADPFPDTRVTYVGRKELPGGQKTKTEIVVESKLTEEVDVSEGAGQDYLLGMDGQDKEGLKGKATEKMIGDIINLGLKGRRGTAKVVNVEIVEEPLSYVGGEKAGEVSTPFHVQEVDDMSPGSPGLAEEAGYGEAEVTFSGHQRKKTELSQENVSQVEEVTEAGDSEGEQNYFVSTPDEGPERDNGHDRDEGSVYGQIHIEEESTIRYSWQDEIVPGFQRTIRGPDALGEKVVKPLDIPEPSLKGDVSSPPWKEQARSGAFHAEATVIEKEIKIPHEIHTSIRRDPKEPRHELREVIGQLEESLPGRLEEELSALTREAQGGSGSVSVDVKQVQTSGGGAMTLVAEVNLSETVATDQLNLELLGKDEAGEIEKAVESVVRDAVARRYSPAPGSPDREAAGPAPVAGFGFKRWATQELYRPSAEDDDTGWASRSIQRVTSQGPVSATVEVTSPTGFAQSHVLEDVSQSVRHIKIDSPGIWRTERVPREGPTAEVVEVSGEGSPNQTASSVGASWSVRHLTLGPDQSQVSKEIIFEGPVPAFWEAGGTAEAGPAELSTGTDKPGGHSMFGSKEFHAQREMIFQSSASGAGKAGDYFRTEESVGTQTSVKHLQLGPSEGLSAQTQFAAPLADTVELGVRGASVHTQQRIENGTPIRHVTIGPHRLQTTEQAVPRPGELSDSGSWVHGAGSADGTQVSRSYTVGRKVLMTDESTFHGAISESPQEASGGDTSGAEATLGRSLRHIRLGPGETQTSEHIVFHGPISKTFTLAGSADAPEPGETAGGIRTQRHIALGPKETSFTFQMDVRNVEATPSWTREPTVLFPTGTEAEAQSVSDSGSWRDAGSRNGQAASRSAQGKEQAEFDKTVQLQRMVDQRSVVSDEKQVAVLYLDNQEEEDEGRWF